MKALTILIGVILGIILGGVIGLLLGLGVVALPGLGPIVAAGSFATALGTATFGAGIGALIGGGLSAVVVTRSQKSRGFKR